MHEHFVCVIEWLSCINFSLLIISSLFLWCLQIFLALLAAVFLTPTLYELPIINLISLANISSHYILGHWYRS